MKISWFIRLAAGDIYSIHNDVQICMRTAEVICVVVMITYTVRVKYISHNSYNGTAKFMNVCSNLFSQNKNTPHMPACLHTHKFIPFI